MRRLRLLGMMLRELVHYRGAFGGPGWDGMWIDMSEIVRPTRDGIHGRETISTVAAARGGLEPQASLTVALVPARDRRFGGGADLSGAGDDGGPYRESAEAPGRDVAF